MFLHCAVPCKEYRSEYWTQRSVHSKDKLLFLYSHLKNIHTIFFFDSWLATTDPADVARVESKTFISTEEKHDTVPRKKQGVKGTLGNWMSPEDMETALDSRFPGCMRGM